MPCRQRPPPPNLQGSQADVRRDPVEPGAHRAARLVVPFPRPPCPQERVLDQVFGVVSRAEHPVAVRQELRPERIDQAIEAFYRRRHTHAPSLPSVTQTPHLLATVTPLASLHRRSEGSRKGFTTQAPAPGCCDRRRSATGRPASRKPRSHSPYPSREPRLLRRTGCRIR